MSDYQFGFHTKHSTVSLLSEAVQDWAFSLEQRNSVHSLFLDLAKAFDSVSHNHLLLRLDSLWTGFRHFLFVDGEELLLIVRHLIGSL